MELTAVCFNLRTQVLSDGKNQFVKRAPFILERILAYKPDVIGFQECTTDMRLTLALGLDEYYFAGSGRSEKRLGESSPVAFRRDRFFLDDCATYWLSPTPDLPGSMYAGDQSDNPRVVTCITLTEADSGFTFRVYNLHADHIGQNARVMAFRQLSELLKADMGRDSLPFILMGDFNAQPQSPEIRELLSRKTPRLVDVSRGIGATFHHFGQPMEDVNYLKRIDFIIIPETARAISCELWKDERNGLYLSDHYPVQARLAL